MDYQKMSFEMLRKFTHYNFNDKKYFGDIKYFSNRFDNSKKIYFVCIDKNKIVGMTELQQNPDDKKIIWITFVSVDPSYRNMGIAKKLLYNSFDYVNKENKAFQLSAYTEMGKTYLEKIVKNLSVVFSNLKIIHAVY